MAKKQPKKTRQQQKGKSRKVDPSIQRSTDLTLYWILFILVVLVALFIRIRLLDVPLERDEGDYATNAMLLLEGTPLSSDLIMKRFTLIYYLYMGWFILFGQSDTGIHLGLLVCNLASIGGIYLLGSELKDQKTGILAATAFAIFSLSYTINGINANREPFLVTFAIFGMWYLLKALQKKIWWHYAIAGLLMGASFAVKQHGAFFLLFGGLWLVYYEWVINKAAFFKIIRNGLLYSIGGLFLFGLILLQYKLAGAYEGFYENTFQSSAEYVQMRGPAEGWSIFKDNFSVIFNENFLPLLLAIPGLLYVLGKKQIKKNGVFLVLLLLLSFASTVPGWYFRPHYFMILAPVVALLAAWGIQGVQHFLSQKIAASSARMIAGLLLVALVLQPLISQANYFFEADETEASRIVFQKNPFPEAKVLSDFIRQNTTEDDKIMVLGSEPELYFYSRRKPAISAYYMYRLMRPTERASQRQQEVIAEAESDLPAMIIFYDMPVSWMKTSESDNSIFEWLNKISRQYQLVGIADILHDYTNYVFGPEAQSYNPRSSGKIYVFQRRSGV